MRRFEDVLPGLFVVFLIAVGAVLLGLLLLRDRRQQQLRDGTLLRNAARVLASPIAYDASTAMPFLRLQLKGLQAFYSLWPYTADSWQVFSHLEIRIGCEGFFEAVSWRGRRYPTVTTRITRIDVPSDYSVMTSEPAWGRRILEKGIEAFLEDLERRLRAPLRLQLTPSRVTLEAERRLDGLGAQVLVEAGERLLDLLDLAPNAAGIAILETSLAADGARCPVCGFGADADAVACPVCRTPHHRECRAYLGRCGIFGCSGGH